MSKKQRQTFVERLPPNFHEWDAVLNEETTIKELKVIAAKTLVVSGSMEDATLKFETTGGITALSIIVRRLVLAKMRMVVLFG